jgi:hypothetical protein
VVVALREDVLDRPARHPADQVAGRGFARRQVRRRGPAVLEYGDPVADLADLLQPVRDIDDRDAVRCQLPDDPEQVAHLVVGEHGTRLVHDDQPGVVGQRPRHAHDLLAGRRQQPHEPLRRDLGVTQPAQDLPGPGVDQPATDEAEAAGLVAEERILRDRQLLDEIQLLVDRRYAGPHRGLRIGERGRLPPPLDVAGVWPVRPGQNLDQRGLAGAVLPEQAVHLARAHLELDAVQRPYTRERLDDVREPQDHVVSGGVVGGAHDACSNATSLASTAAPVTPARAPSSDSTTGRFPVASGSERR